MTYYFGDWSTEIYFKLLENAALVALATGGIHVQRGQYKNFDRKTNPGSYDANGFLKPTIVIRGRDALNQQVARSQNPNQKFTIVTQVIEIWYYDSPLGGWNTLNPMAELVYESLEQEKVEDAWNIELVGQMNTTRERDLGDAPFLMHEYMIVGKL